MGEQLDMFPNGEVEEDQRLLNPMIRAYGTGPQGTKCRECEHFGYVQYSKRYYKCELRGMNGKSTDHGYYWQSCAKYRERTEADGTD